MDRRVMHHVVGMVHVAVMMVMMHHAVVDHLGLGAAGRHEWRQGQAEDQGQGSDPAATPGLADRRGSAGGGAGQDGHGLDPFDMNRSRPRRALS
jgi:hypothetical protein